MHDKSSTVLVLGGCGFIGRHVVQALVSKQLKTIVFDRHAEPASSSELCLYRHSDFSSQSALDSVFAEHDITHVIHLVSTTLPKTSNENMQFDVASNVIETLHLLDLCVRHQTNKVLFMSSGGTVYGKSTVLPLKETHPTDPICSYGIGKLMIEKYLALYKHLHGLDYVSLRASNPYGAGQNPLSGQGIVANFVHKLSAGQALQVWGDGRIVRDYFEIGDLVALTLQALFSDETGVFNAGSGTGSSINELIAILKDITGKPPEVDYLQQRTVDVPAIVLDCSKALQVFGWKVQTPLKEGISNYIQWTRNQSSQNH